MSNTELIWECESASYIANKEGLEINVFTLDGKSWVVTVRNHLIGSKWRVVCEIRGLKDQSTAYSVAKQLYNLAKTISLKDTYNEQR